MYSNLKTTREQINWENSNVLQDEIEIIMKNDITDGETIIITKDKQPQNVSHRQR